jgi:hypothetical protein
MSQQPDRHSKRVAADAEHWLNWLERLVVLRRAGEGGEDGQLNPGAERRPG